MSIFSDKVLLITGGTGSFGNAVLRRFLNSDIREIRIFSRDEKKQDDMRHFLQANHPDVAGKVKFYIGNVRNREAVDFAMNGVDYVFSAAALKQVPSCEFYPMEAVRTNVEGTNNVLLSAIAHGVKNVVVLSTDKAAYPINAMGISKAMMEKVAIAQGRALGPDAKTTICCTRYGNVMASRGSVIPLWVEQMIEGKPITITDPNMTRFMMTLDDAVDLVMYAFEHGHNGDLFVQKTPAAPPDAASGTRLADGASAAGRRAQREHAVQGLASGALRRRSGRPAGADARLLWRRGLPLPLRTAPSPTSRTSGHRPAAERRRGHHAPLLRLSGQRHRTDAPGGRSEPALRRHLLRTPVARPVGAVCRAARGSAHPASGL